MVFLRRTKGTLHSINVTQVNKCNISRKTKLYVSKPAFTKCFTLRQNDQQNATKRQTNVKFSSLTDDRRLFVNTAKRFGSSIIFNIFVTV